jgi:hypothetical protein
LTGNVRVEKNRNAFPILVGGLAKNRRTEEIKIKIYLKGMSELFSLDLKKASVSGCSEHFNEKPGLKNSGNLFASLAALGFSRRICSIEILNYN